MNLPCCVPGTAHIIRVSLYFSIMEVKGSPKPSQMEAKGVAVLQRGVSVTVPRKAVAPLRKGTAKVRGDLPVRARRPDVYYVHLWGAIQKSYSMKKMHQS